MAQFNSDQYAWNDITVRVAGVDMVTLQGIKFKKAKPKTNIYGKGDEVIGRRAGNVELTGEVSILQSDLETLNQSLPPGKDITDIRFGITWVFAQEEGGQQTVYELENCEVDEWELGFSQGAAKSDNITIPVHVARYRVVK